MFCTFIFFFFSLHRLSQTIACFCGENFIFLWVLLKCSYFTITLNFINYFVWNKWRLMRFIYHSRAIAMCTNLFGLFFVFAGVFVYSFADFRTFPREPKQKTQSLFQESNWTSCVRSSTENIIDFDSMHLWFILNKVWKNCWISFNICSTNHKFHEITLTFCSNARIERNMYDTETPCPCWRSLFQLLRKEREAKKKHCSACHKYMPVCLQ